MAAPSITFATGNRKKLEEVNIICEVTCDLKMKMELLAGGGHSWDWAAAAF
jgi:hypothetical protein